MLSSACSSKSSCTEHQQLLAQNTNGSCDCRWGGVVETHMKFQLESYVLHDHHDLAAFKRICSQLSIKMPNVTISRFDVPQHAIPSTRRPTGVESVMDVLSCNDKQLTSVVLNYIVDTVRSMHEHDLSCSLNLKINCVSSDNNQNNQLHTVAAAVTSLCACEA